MPVLIGPTQMDRKITMIPDTGVIFADVAGCDAAKLELEEVLDLRWF